MVGQCDVLRMAAQALFFTAMRAQIMEPSTPYTPRISGTVTIFTELFSGGLKI
jgi:hypothetical protein